MTPQKNAMARILRLARYVIILFVSSSPIQHRDPTGVISTSKHPNDTMESSPIIALS